MVVRSFGYTILTLGCQKRDKVWGVGKVLVGEQEGQPFWGPTVLPSSLYFYWLPICTYHFSISLKMLLLYFLCSYILSTHLVLPPSLNIFFHHWSLIPECTTCLPSSTIPVFIPLDPITSLIPPLNIFLTFLSQFFCVPPTLCSHIFFLSPRSSFRPSS